MTEEEKASLLENQRKKDAARYVAMMEEEKDLKQKKDAARYATMTEEEKASLLENQ